MRCHHGSSFRLCQGPQTSFGEAVLGNNRPPWEAIIYSHYYLIPFTSALYSEIRRLGLVPNQAPNLSRTLGTLVDTLNKLQTASRAEAELKTKEGASIYGMRSEPPCPVPTPPTLAPEPLMLSPLNELPYLFALEAPGSADQLLMPAEGLGGGSAGPRYGKKKTNRVLATRNERVSEIHVLIWTEAN